jgi:hypothetical protein
LSIAKRAVSMIVETELVDARRNVCVCASAVAENAADYLVAVFLIRQQTP